MSERLCPSCRRPLSDDARFCVECGSRIDFQSTRKELDEGGQQEVDGLKINKAISISNPFCSKSEQLKAKIVDPDLKPLPEKKKVIFKEWESIKTEVVESVEPEVQEEPIAEQEVAFEPEIPEIVVPEEIEETEEEKPAEIPEEIPEEVSEEIPEEIQEEVDLVEEPTDFEALKALFEEKEVVEELLIESEVPEQPESEPETPAAAESEPEATFEPEIPEIVVPEGIEETEEEKPAEIPEEIPEEVSEEIPEEVSEEIPEEIQEEVDLVEEPTDFEALKALFEENEVVEEPLIESEVPEEPESEPKVPEEPESEPETPAAAESEPEVPEEPIEEPEEEKPAEIPEEIQEVVLEEVPEEIPEESPEEIPEEIQEEIDLVEEPTDFEVLKALFEEREVPIEPIAEPEFLKSPKLLIAEPEVAFEPKIPEIFVPEVIEEPEKEKKRTKEEPVKPVTEIKPNRIITTSVGGGFKKKEPQAEEVKDITGFFMKKNKRRK